MDGYHLVHFENAKKVPFNVDGRILYQSEGYELIYLTLQPGEGMELHTQPFDVVFFILKGSGLLTIGKTEIEISHSTSVYVETGVLRSWKNIGSVPLQILVNKLISLSS